LNPSKKVGWLVKKKFSELINKWTLYTGVNTAEYIESIGNIIKEILSKYQFILTYLQKKNKSIITYLLVIIFNK